MKLPNGYGSVVKLSGKRRKPYQVRKTTGWHYDKEKDRQVQDMITVGYAATRAEGLQMLAEYNNNPFDTKAAKMTLSSCFQNHMNTLAAETASAWYLILNRKRPTKKVIASYFNMIQFSSHLPRNPDDGNIAGLRWRGCHNSAASFYSCAAGFPPSL